MDTGASTCRFSPHDESRGACRKGGTDKIMAVEALAPQRHEHVTGSKRPRVYADTGHG